MEAELGIEATPAEEEVPVAPEAVPAEGGEAEAPAGQSG
jgi:hypothetical protein